MDLGDTVVTHMWQRVLAAFHADGRRALGGEAAVAMAWLQATEAARVVAPAGQDAQARAQSREEAEAALWWLIGSAEGSSEHPLAKELSRVAASKVRGQMSKPSNFKNTTGQGVSCAIGGLEVCVASAKHVLAMQRGTGAALALQDWVEAARADGSTVVCVAVDGTPLAGVALRDTLAPGARAHVAALQMAGVEVWMCTGDHGSAARVVAKEVGIDQERVVAEAMPNDKVAVVQKLQEEGGAVNRRYVAMVGDGVNDAPALAAADLGVAIGAGHDVTVEAADIVLVRTDLADLVAFFALARATLRTIWRNFLWAFVFNSCALPVAAGALWHRGIVMTPQIAVCLMLSSSLFVIFSSLSLRNFDPAKADAYA